MPPKKARKATTSNKKQTSLLDHLSSPARPPSPSKMKRQTPTKPKRNISEIHESDSSDIAAIKFEPTKVSSDDEDEEVQASARKRRKVIVVHSDSDEAVEVTSPKDIKGKKRASTRLKTKREIQRPDSDSEEVVPKSTRKRKLVKGKRPPKDEESSDDSLSDSHVLENRFRDRSRKSAFQKNLERLKRKKQGKPMSSESEAEIEEEEEEEAIPFKGAKPSEKSLFTDDEDDEDESEPEDDWIVEDDGAGLARLPAEFSMETHQDLSHQFKKIFQFFVHIATRKVEDRHDFVMNTLEHEEYFSVPLHALRRALLGLRDTAVASSVWRPDFKRALGKYPDFHLTRMDFAVPGCDACHLGARMSTYMARVSGKVYDRLGYGPEDESDDERASDEEDSDSDEDVKVKLKTEFHLGRFCARRTQVYHDISHWEYTLFQSVDQEIRSLRSGNKNGFIRVAFAGGKEPPKDLDDADAICDWLDERRIIDVEWQRIKDLMDKTRNLEMAAKKGQDDD